MCSCTGTPHRAECGSGDGRLTSAAVVRTRKRIALCRDRECLARTPFVRHRSPVAHERPWLARTGPRSSAQAPHRCTGHRRQRRSHPLLVAPSFPESPPTTPRCLVAPCFPVPLPSPRYTSRFTPTIPHRCTARSLPDPLRSTRRGYTIRPAFPCFLCIYWDSIALSALALWLVNHHYDTQGANTATRVADSLVQTVGGMLCVFPLVRQSVSIWSAVSMSACHSCQHHASERIEHWKRSKRHVRRGID